MTAQFGGWPPAPIGCKVIGRCLVNGNGTLAYSSKYADGTPVFSSVKNATGDYSLTLGKLPPTTAQIAVTAVRVALAAAATVEAKPQSPAGTFGVLGQDYAGVAIDTAFSAVLLG